MSDNYAEIRGNNNRVDQSENSGVRVSGEGHKVNVTMRRTYIKQYRTEVRNQLAHDTNSSSGEGLAIVAATAVVTVALAWLYLKHFETIVEHLRDAIMLSAVPVIGALALFFKKIRDDRANVGDAVPLFAGPLAALLLMWILNLTIEQLPERLIAVAATQGIKDFWFTLSSSEHRILLENLISVVCIGIAAIVNAFMNVHTLADELFDISESPVTARLYALSFKFRLSRSLAVQLALAVIAGLAITGKGLELMEQLQVYMHGLLS
ncbi:hypothetical protein [Paraburkholderia caribensis]|uniref:hypothetical protein n=1 Tax=Paraburkholderia caribensis TaxID=75105 RepID=UPI001591E100|nr:hypothetical protein [Paraburkholderia caribensis]